MKLTQDPTTEEIKGAMLMKRGAPMMVMTK